MLGGRRTQADGMTVHAYAQFTGDPGDRQFVHGATPLSIGDTVRVTGYGYGATLDDCGRTGQVVAVHRTRVDIDFGTPVGIRRLGGSVLALIQAPPGPQPKENA